MRLSFQQIKQFQTKILDWYAEHRRDLPWRQNRDPYKILVSEVMLQQTQVSRVIPKYTAWLETFPTIHVLAKASVSDVLSYWSGLGYNRRALNLKKAAHIISIEYNGMFPQDEKKLLEFPGIGQYTSRALLCFAFDKQIAVVDTNVRKVILKEVLKGTDEPKGQKDIQLIADQLLPHGLAYEWNQALMDYAGSVLKKEKIDMPKQSKFVGSHRYYRGKVLKMLLEEKKVPFKQLGEMLKKDDEVWLHALISELKDEGFVVINNNVISLA